MLGSGVPAAADNIYCVVVGAKQGAFQTGKGSGPNAMQIPVLFLTQEVSVPFDQSTGLSTGKRTHSPLTIVKALDESSIQFFNAAVTNEDLTSVTCTLYRDRGEGTQRAYYRIKLTNAAVVDDKDAGDGANGAAHDDERERISLSYQKIELTYLDTGATATDDW